MNTRKWVWQALEAICLEGAYSNLYLQQNLRQELDHIVGAGHAA